MEARLADDNSQVDCKGRFVLLSRNKGPRAVMNLQESLRWLQHLHATSTKLMLQVVFPTESQLDLLHLCFKRMWQWKQTWDAIFCVQVCLGLQLVVPQGTENAFKIRLRRTRVCCIWILIWLPRPIMIDVVIRMPDKRTFIQRCPLSVLTTPALATTSETEEVGPSSTTGDLSDVIPSICIQASSHVVLALQVHPKLVLEQELNGLFLLHVLACHFSIQGLLTNAAVYARRRLRKLPRKQIGRPVHEPLPTRFPAVAVH
mmetsp:Transcript_15023/g.33747  ORF Transcript_15023/g.33747 Transcript_15023/m.33747 type:complete len:259 (-) Transcript_15023:392-1168(-)